MKLNFGYVLSCKLWQLGEWDAKVLIGSVRWKTILTFATDKNDAGLYFEMLSEKYAISSL